MLLGIGRNDLQRTVINDKVMRCLGWECNLHTNLIENDSFIEVPKRRKQRLRCFLLLRQDNAKQTAHSTGKERTHEHPQTHRL